MASDDYRIPWGPMDYSGIADAIRGFRAERHADAADKRANEYLDMEREAVRNRAERESAALARQKEQDDYNRRVKAFEAMPALYRAAQKSVGMANQNPYGVKFDESFVAPDQTKADDEISKFLAGEARPERPTVERQLRPNEEGPEQTPEAEAARFASTDNLMDQATTGTPLDTMTMAAANAMGAPVRRLHATYQGQRFEVPEQSDKTPFGPEYDTIYQGMLETGEDPHKAMQFVATQYKADQTQQNIARRTAANTAALIGAREMSREDQQQFQAEQNKLWRSEPTTAAERERLARIRAAASGEPERKADKLDLAIERETDAIVKEVLNQSGYKNRIADDQKFNQMSTVIAGAKSNAALAAAGAGMWVKQAQGGTGVISDGDMRAFWDRIGGVPDKVENYISTALSGKMGAGKQKIVADAIKTLAAQSKRNLDDIGKRIEARLRPIGEQVPQVDERIQTYLDTYVPGSRRASTPRRGAQRTELDQIEEALDRLGGGGGR